MITGGLRHAREVSRIPAWDTANMANFDPHGERIYGSLLDEVLGQQPSGPPRVASRISPVPGMVGTLMRRTWILAV